MLYRYYLQVLESTWLKLVYSNTLYSRDVRLTITLIKYTAGYSYWLLNTMTFSYKLILVVCLLFLGSFEYFYMRVEFYES